MTNLQMFAKPQLGLGRPSITVVFKLWVATETEKMGRQDDLRKMYVCNQVQDSGKKQLNKHKQQNESNRQPPQVRIKYVFVFALCFCSVVHCSKSETYLLISITQWPIRGVLVSQNPLTAQNASVLVQSRVLEARDANPLIIMNKV